MRLQFILLAFTALSLAGCDKDVSSRSAKITYVKVTAWPATGDNLLPWDATSSPDIYLRLLDMNGLQLSNDPLDDVLFPNASGTINRTIETPYRVPSPLTDYQIELVDDDDVDADDPIGMVDFNLSDYPDQPAAVFRTVGGISMEIGLQWEQ